MARRYSHSEGTKSPRDRLALHIRVTEDLYGKLLARLAEMRKKDSMANLSDAVRDALTKGLR